MKITNISFKTKSKRQSLKRGWKHIYSFFIIDSFRIHKTKASGPANDCCLCYATLIRERAVCTKTADLRKNMERFSHTCWSLSQTQAQMYLLCNKNRRLADYSERILFV